MTLLLALIVLAVGFLAGWQLRRFFPDSTSTHGHEVSPEDLKNYFAGLNYITDREPDTSIDIFITSLEQGADQVDSRLALSTLLRRRGRADRSISLCQQMLAQEDLTREQGFNVRMELARNFIAAGLLDRVEKLLADLIVEDSPVRLEALELAVSVYQLGREWDKARTVTKRLLGSGLCGRPERYRLQLSHYCCELVEAELQQRRDPAAIQRLLKEAREALPDNLRVGVLRLLYMLDDVSRTEGVKLLRQLAAEQPEYLSEILRMLFERNPARAKALLDAVLETAGRHDGASIPLTVTTLEAMRGRAGDETTLKLALDAMPDFSPPDLCRKVLELLLACGIKGDQGFSAERLGAIVGTYLEKLAHFICIECGFEGKILHWQCPGCNRWGTFVPVTTSLSPGGHLRQEKS